ncbi:hypothetical protein [Magnetospirillum sp. 64-120]|uniref:hypothetical protein n=1 Tax=Magnetospirillum sp. 64-120 TaxID=1895778 RepID=UPI0025C33071|nr:hypothetical protein [Magnetospirillum sp. 64-120]
MRPIFLLVLPLAACAGTMDTSRPAIPGQISGKAEIVAASDPAWGQANVAAAEKPPGLGGVSQAVVIRLNQDVAVYRMWNGPQQGARSNRMGGWWAFDKPKGTREGYRRAYEICGTWNDLKRVAVCTLKKGAVVAIGPGQSVSAETCKDESGHETYGANPQDWQVYVDQAWNRPETLACPPEDLDYEADPADVSTPKAKS